MRPPEPRTVEELLQRYRDSRRRLGLDAPPEPVPYPAPPRPAPVATPEDAFAQLKKELGIKEDVAHLLRPTTTARNSIKMTFDRIENDRAEFKGLSKLHPDLRRIVTQVAEETGVPIFTIVGKTRVDPVVAARHEVFRRIKDLPWRPSMGYIARAFDIDHTSVLSALRKRREPCE